MDDQPPRGYRPGEEPVRADLRPHDPKPVETHPYGVPRRFVEPPRRRRFLSRLLWLILLALIVVGIVWWVLHRSQPAGTGRFPTGGPMPVGTATVQKGDMPIIDNALGTVTPLATVTVQTQINGQLMELGFQEGQLVNKGDFLAQIDPRPYEVALEQAQGQLAKDQAALANSKVDLARYEKLVAQNSIATQTLDTQRATVAQNIGLVQVDQAQVDAQKLNLIYCRITAPVAGRVGLRQVDTGNFIQTSNSTGIVVVTELQPISVIFTLPEDNLPAVLKQVHAGKTLQVTALDRAGKNEIEVGELATIDNQIDTTTGTVKLRAMFANKTYDLFPNQFVNIKLKVDTVQGAPIVPDSAIQRGAPGTFVYLTKSDGTVAAQPVTLGPDDGSKVAVLKGLEPGQVIVVDGADRLKDGAKITVTALDGKPTQQPQQGQPGGPGGQSGQGGQGSDQGRGQREGRGQGSGQRDGG